MATAKNSGKKSNVYWDKDGVDGGKSSLDVLLNWMTIGTNYNRWRGADRTVKEIMVALETANISHRTPGQVRDKVSKLEEKYCAAQDFLAQTGAGIADQATLRDALRQRMEKRQALEDAKKEELRLKRREADLKEERNKREAEQASIALAIQQVQLEAAKRDSIVQLLLARKRLADNSIPDDEINSHANDTSFCLAYQKFRSKM
ncbi:hypothetical protein PInf_026351 [Phytophthora infestans]|nr:hypothetical protein PInf_026351 [Phytophthora infestans]